MRSLGLVVLAAACGTNDPGWDSAREFSFGPFTIQPNQEISDQCVQITLNNDQPVYINSVELNTGPGFHHSNWFYVRADGPGVVGAFPGPDGTFKCADRGFDQAIAALYGGVLFAQSTQSQHDIQAFPDGAAIQVPAHYKLVSTIHLLNASDMALHLTPTIKLTPIPEASVTTFLAGMSFEDHALGLPPGKQSSFTLDCDFQPEWDILRNQGRVTAPSPDFKIYYALAHYHALGTGMTIEALHPDGSGTTTMFSTSMGIGDALGATLAPPFDMTGFSRLRLSCDYYNNTDATVGWGIGNQEMCVFLAFSDSNHNWGGGAVTDDPPGDPTDVGGVMTYTHACEVHATELSTH
jgi:hypothetical protein